MKTHLRALLLGLGLSTAAASPAAAYPVDCAILLCLAGGWPASTECAHARAVFIRRITPWPIEPPLQIWNCPMRASFRQEERPTERFFDISVRGEPAPLVSIPETPLALQLVQDRADVDISDPTFDFVRSIRVFHVQAYQWRTRDGMCFGSIRVERGSYGMQGEFQWARVAPSAVPQSSTFKYAPGCMTVSFRGVFVDWRDHQGTYGYEEVRY